MSTDQQTPVVFGITRKSLEAVVIHACPHCDAPGVYKNDERTAQFWPGCWHPDAMNQPVGDRCPNCGKRRITDTTLGEITASMPRWIWQCILGVKWFVIKMIALRRRMEKGHA